MGAKSVGALQYDTENMEASCHISISDDDEIEAIFPVFSLLNQNDAQNGVKGNSVNESGDGIRKRNVKGKKNVFDC